MKNAAQRLWGSLCEPTCDGKLIPLDLYKAYSEGSASGIEFIMGIPRDEIHVLKSILGDKNYRDMVLNAVYNMKVYMESYGAGDVQEDVQEYIKAQMELHGELEAKSKFIEQLISLSVYRSTAKLSQSGSKVYLMYWDEKPLIENLGSGTIDAAATLLGNSEASQIYGNVMNADLSETPQNLLQKFIEGKPLELYNNEIKGVNAFTWQEFPQALIVSDQKIKSGAIEGRLTEIKSLFDFAMK